MACEEIGLENAFIEHEMFKRVAWTLKFPRPPKLHETHKHHACLSAHHGISGIFAGAWYGVTAQLSLRVVERKEPRASLVLQ